MANSLRHSTIGFTVSGNIEKLERANKLLDKMPKQVAAMEKAFKGTGLSKAFDKQLSSMQKSVSDFSKTTDKQFASASKTVTAFNKNIGEIPDKKAVKIDVTTDQATLDRFGKQADHATRSRTVKVKDNTSEAMTRMEKYSSHSTSALQRVSDTSQRAFGKMQNKLRQLNETTGQTGHLFTKVFASTMVSNAILNSWSSLTNGIKEAAKAGWEYSKEQNQMAMTWTTLAGNRKDALSMRSEINQRALDKGQDIGIVNEAAQGFYHLNSDRKQTKNMSNALFNMSDAVGLSNPQTQTLMNDMVHTMSGGVVQTNDLNIIGQYLPMFNESLKEFESKKTGKKVDGTKLRAMAKGNQISVEDYEKVFETLGNKKYAAAAENMMKTFNGMQRVIKAREGSLMSKVTDPVMNTQSKLYGGISKWVSAKKTEKEFDELGKAVAKSVNQISDAFGKAFNIKSGPELLDKAVTGLTDKVTKLGDYMEKHPDQLRKFFESTKNITSGTIGVYTEALKDLMPVLKMVGDFAEKNPKLFGTLAGGILAVNTSAKILKGTLGGVLTVAGGIGDVFKGGKWLASATGMGGKIGNSGKSGSGGNLSRTLGKITSAFSVGGTTAGKHFSTKAKTTLANGGVVAGKNAGKHFSTKAKTGLGGAGAFGGGKFSKVVRSAGWVSLGLLAGQGMFTSKTAKGRIHGAGEGIGTAVGLYLGGPVGAMIGDKIGGAIADKIMEQTPKSFGSEPSKDQRKKGGKSINHSTTVIGPMGVTQIGDDAEYNSPALYNSSNKKISASARAFGSNGKSASKKVARSGIKKFNAFSHAQGGLISNLHTAMVGENGEELLQRGKKFSLLGKKGAEMVRLRAGDRIYKHSDTVKMLAGDFNHRLPNFAEGNAKLKTQRSAGKRGVTVDVDAFGASGKKSAKSLSKLQKGAKKQWNQIAKDTGKSATQMHKDTVKEFDTMQKSAQTQVNQLHKGMNSTTKDMVGDFGTIMGRLDNYANKAMSNAIKQLNRGFVSLNSVLSQFGGNQNTLRLAHYAQGSKGPINHDHLAVVNDATNGPRQEAIYDPKAGFMFPKGQDVVVPLKRGQEVLNGNEVQRHFGDLPHYAKGTDGLKRIISRNDSHPGKAYSNDFSGKVATKLGTSLGTSLASVGKQAAQGQGRKWYSTAWDVLKSAMSGGGAGGNWAHTPGAGWSTGASGQRFGDSRSGGTHDGVDFGASLGTPFRAFHGGRIARIGTPPGNWGGGALGKIIEVHSDDGFREIYQEFGGMKNIKVAVGDIIKTGQILGTLGPLNGAGSGAHLHVGVSHGSLWDHGGMSTRGWFDVTKMHGNSDGSSKSAKKANSKDSALTKLVKRQLSSQIKWVGKHLVDEDALGGFSGGISMGGGLGSRARALAAALQKLYPAANLGGIAGILGNWMQESRLDPNAINSSDHGSGLAQWTAVRETRMRNWTKKHGYKWNDAKGQLLYALNEPGMSGEFKRVLRMKSPTAAARAFFAGWESGGAMDATGGTRLGNAQNAYKAIKNHANGGWSDPNRTNIFGEVKGEPEVAINPKRDSADRLIYSAINARAKSKPNGSIANLAKIISFQNAAKKRKKLAAEVNKAFHGNSGHSTITGASGGINITINQTLNFGSGVSKKEADYAANANAAQVRKVVRQEINRLIHQAVSETELG